MRGLAYTIASVALLAGTAAHAQTMQITGYKSGSIYLGEDKVGGANSVHSDLYDVNMPNPADNWSFWQGGSSETSVKITPGSAAFESGVAVGGLSALGTSSSGLDIKIQNNTEDQVISIGKFGSTIVPAGMGFYMQDRSGDPTGGNIFTGYGQNDAYGLADLWPSVGEGVFAYSTFDFDVTSGATTLYTLSGYLSLSFTSDGTLQRNYGLTDAKLAMPSLDVEFDNDAAYAYFWQATNIDFDLNAVLNPGDWQTLNYRTTVSSYTKEACIDETTCLVAYSGFGDPIGRGGGLSLVAARGAALNDECGDTRICGIDFDTGTVKRFDLINVTSRDVNAGIPEPSTWALLILGFGVSGAALRRRRMLSYS